MKSKVVGVIGANASGKSSLGVSLAESVNGEILSADSRQIYRGLNLGSGKITRQEMKGVRHHLIDIVDPGEEYSLFDYQRDAFRCIESVVNRDRAPLIVGGTGLYINSILSGYMLLDVPPNVELRQTLRDVPPKEIVARIYALDPAAREHLDHQNPRRLMRTLEILQAGYAYADTRAAQPRYRPMIVGVLWERDQLRARIWERLSRRIESGMIEEVEELLSLGISQDFFWKLGLEYRFTLRYIWGEFCSLNDFKEGVYFAICQFAKRQYTWFRKLPGVEWYMGEALERGRERSILIDRVKTFLKLR